MPFIIPYDNYERQENLHLETLKVIATEVPTKKVYVTPGQFWYKGNHINWQGQVSNPLPSPISDSHWVVVSLRMVSDTDANLVFTAGSPATNPDLPSIPQQDVPLAAVKLSILDTKVYNNMIIDLRPYWAPIVATDELSAGIVGSTRTVETVILDADQITCGGVNLQHRAEAGTVVVLVSGGTPQQENVDWELTQEATPPPGCGLTGTANKRVHWKTANLEGLVAEDDVLIITYNKYQTT